MARLKNHGPAYWLNPSAAAAFDHMEDEQGFIDLNSAGRTVAEQQELINRWNRGGAANRPPYLYKPAMPATASRHVMNGGIAFDTSEWRRVKGFAARYGFKWWGDSDPVHFEYVGGGSSSGGSTVVVSQEVKNQQNFLNQKRGENLAVDGQIGPATKAAIARYQQFLRGYGYTGDFDGIWGAGTQAAHQKYYDSVNASTPGQIIVDGQWGEATTRELQKRLGGVTVDGQWGSESRKALQVALNAAPFDGQAGPITNKAFQTFLQKEGFYTGAIDGEFGYNSIVALQKFLNTGRKFYAVVTTPTTPTQPPAPVVEPAKAVKPILPWAIRGWDAPKGREKRADGSKITAFAIHHTASLVDQEAYFKGTTGSIPTWYVRDDVIEMTRPGLRPVTTANSNNFSVSAETQNITGAPEWKVSDKSVEQLAQIAAWLHSYDGKTLDGIPVEFKLDRQHIKGHKEFAGNNTACPGPYLEGLLNSIVERAKVIFQEKYVVKPVEPEVPVTPTDPVKPTEPTTPTNPSGTVIVKNSVLEAALKELDEIEKRSQALKIVINNLLGGK